MRTRCRFCQKEIEFVLNRETGKQVPVDARRCTAYQYELDGDGGPVLDNQTPIVRPVLVHLSHWITCPNRDQAAAARDAKRGGG